MKKRSTI